MDRRVFLLSTLALAGCDRLAPGPQIAICDPGLGKALSRARAAYGEGGMAVAEVRPRDLLDQAQAERSAIVVTRQAPLANRLQRLGHVRLEHRWTAMIAGQPAEILVTKGMGPAQWRALKLAKWLAGADAAPHLNAGVPVIFSAP